MAYLQLPQACSLQLLLAGLQLQLQVAPLFLPGQVLGCTAGLEPSLPAQRKQAERQGRDAKGWRAWEGALAEAEQSSLNLGQLGLPGVSPLGRDQYEEGGAREASEAGRGVAWRARAHLARPAAFLLPQVLLQLFVQSAHLPLVFALTPLRNGDTTGMNICQLRLCPHRGPQTSPGRPSPPQRLLQTVALPSRRLQAGRRAHQNFLQRAQ